LGLWIEQTEGAKFWLKVINELKARGVNDSLIAALDRKPTPHAAGTVIRAGIILTIALVALPTPDRPPGIR
jgi:transposase-like protein